MGGNWFYCDFPIEINGSHWHCAYGIFILGGLCGNGPNFGGTLGLQIGVGGGNCCWACPDLTQAEQPNPPGAWKNKATPEKCKTVGEVPKFLGPEPLAPPAPPAEPLARHIGISESTGAEKLPRPTRKTLGSVAAESV